MTLTAFLAASSLVLLVSLMLGDRSGRLESRLRASSPSQGGAGPTAPDRASITKLAETTLPRIGTPFVPSDEEERTSSRPG